jgi:hypothetical protein
MQKQRQVKQFGIFQLREQLRIAFVPFRFRFSQPVQAFDGDNGMFIHGEAMIKVTHYQ